MRLSEIQQLVAQGESSTLEFKATTGQRTEAAKTVCAMLNGRGGFVLFGVTPDGVIRGQQLGGNTLDDVATELRKVDPAAFPDLETEPVSADRVVIVIRVPGGFG